MMHGRRDVLGAVIVRLEPNDLSPFASMGLDPTLLKRLNEAEYKTPTATQKEVIPIIMKGDDLMARAANDSGKTTAYVLPILHKILRNVDLNEVNDKCKPKALILAPTRSHVVKIILNFTKLALYTQLKCAGFFERVPFNVHVSRFQRDLQVVVATPQLITRVLEKNVLDFSAMRFVVLDQLELMLDHEFHPEIGQILSHFEMVSQVERQVLIFTETLSNRVESLANDFLKPNFVRYFAKKGVFSDVCQKFIPIKTGHRLSEFSTLFSGRHQQKIVVFTQTRPRMAALVQFLSTIGLSAVSLDVTNTQEEREETLKHFAISRRKVIVTTHAALLGLDIKFLDHVINYNMPSEVGEYIHRISLFSNVLNRGTSTTLFNPISDRALLPQYANILKNSGQEMPESWKDLVEK